MSTTKIKAIPAAALSTTEIEELVHRIAGLQSTRAEVQRDIDERTAKMDAQIALIRGGFLPMIETWQATVKKLDQTIGAAVNQVEAWARANPEKFQPKRSLELISGTIGFRLSPPKVTTWKPWTFPLCAAALAAIRWGRPYLKFELDKEALIRDRDKLRKLRHNLALAGLKIVQYDVFYVAPKQEHTDSLKARRFRPNTRRPHDR